MMPLEVPDALAHHDCIHHLRTHGRRRSVRRRGGNLGSPSSRRVVVCLATENADKPDTHPLMVTGAARVVRSTPISALREHNNRVNSYLVSPWLLVQADAVVATGKRRAGSHGVTQVCAGW